MIVFILRKIESPASHPALRPVLTSCSWPPPYCPFDCHRCMARYSARIIGFCTFISFPASFLYPHHYRYRGPPFLRRPLPEDLFSSRCTRRCQDVPRDPLYFCHPFLGVILGSYHCRHPNLHHKIPAVPVYKVAVRIIESRSTHCPIKDTDAVPVRIIVLTSGFLLPIAFQGHS